MHEQDLGAAPIGRRVEPGEFDRAGKAQPGIHRRRDEFAIGISGRDARHDFRVADHQVVAALGLERHPVAERSRQRLRIGPGADHRGVGRQIAMIGCDGRQPPSIEPEPQRPRHDDLAALAAELLEQPGDKPERIAGMPVLAHQDSADVIPRQRGFELA